jgi:hypothetical protein
MSNDLITGQRTFCIGLSAVGGGANDIMEIPFYDTAGDTMNCNYIKISCIGNGSTGSQGAWIAEILGLNREGNMVLDGVSALSAAASYPVEAPSGICGIGGVINALVDSTSEWHGSNGQIATGIKLSTQYQVPDGATFMITYGNLYPLNVLRLEQSYTAGA